MNYSGDEELAKFFSKIILELLEKTNNALSIKQIKKIIRNNSDYIRFFENNKEWTDDSESFIEQKIGQIIFNLKNENKILVFSHFAWEPDSPVMYWIRAGTKFIGKNFTNKKIDRMLEPIEKNPHDFQAWFDLFKFYYFRRMTEQSIFCLECIEKEFVNEDYLKKLDEKNLKCVAHAYLNRVYEITNERSFYFKETGKLLENDITLIYKASKIFSCIYQDRENSEKNPDPHDAYSNINGKIIRNYIIKSLSFNFNIDIYRYDKRKILENL
jgi:hypothetical protein